MVGSVISNEDHSSLNKNHWYFISIVVLKYFIGHMTKWNHKVHFCEWGFQPDLRSPEEKVLSSSLRARTATSKRLPGKPGCCPEKLRARMKSELITERSRGASALSSWTWRWSSWCGNLTSLRQILGNHNALGMGTSDWGEMCYLEVNMPIFIWVNMGVFM